MTIEGNNHTIDNINSTFDINTENNELKLTFLNVNFKNLIFTEKNIKNHYNITLINCNLIPKEYNHFISAECYYSNVSYSGNVSKFVKNIAKLIVGESTGIDAIKKIAIWVSKNADHEKKPVFTKLPNQHY